MKINSITMRNIETRDMICIIDEINSTTNDPPCACGCDTMTVDSYVTEEEVQRGFENKNTFILNTIECRCSKCHSILPKEKIENGLTSISSEISQSSNQIWDYYIREDNGDEETKM